MILSSSKAPIGSGHPISSSSRTECSINIPRGFLDESIEEEASPFIKKLLYTKDWLLLKNYINRPRKLIIYSQILIRLLLATGRISRRLFYIRQIIKILRAFSRILSSRILNSKRILSTI
jgi:hypothetical protein